MSATGALSPLVGSPSHNGRPMMPRPVGRVGDAGAPVLPPALARGGAFLALAVFGSLHWMSMLEPMAVARAWAAVGVGVLAMLCLLGSERLHPRLRTLVAVAVALVSVGLAFLAAGVADELLRPDRWGTLAAGVSRGIDALPGARVPYRGIDEWTRIVLALGGTMLVALAALAAFWPRREVTGRPLVALIVLVLLYVVPAVALDFESEFMRGALLVVLVLAFLRLERLRAREAGAAAGLAALAAVVGLMVAPALDGNDPWWDYETWALTTAASQTTSFSWDHYYGPLDWPRDGREMLRVKARQQAYWKAQNLDAFDGRRWERARYGVLETPEDELPVDQRSLNRWTQTIEVSVRNLQSRTFVTAGIALGPPVMPNRVAFPAGPPGIWVTRRPLRRGDTYRARVYTPRPTERELTAAGIFYERDMTGFRTLRIDDPDAPSEQAPGTPLTPPIRATFPFWDSSTPIVVRRESYRPGVGVEQLRGERFLQRSDLRRTWELSKRLKEDAANPFQYVRAVERYLGGSDFTYSESPPESAATLDGFLFDAKRGYCQQYSGAMALLLRMGGVPARVATGFTGGSLDSKTKEYVVRDLDAHSWVEAWFPGLGWVTFDPTPSSAPPRSQGEEASVNSFGDAPQFATGDPSLTNAGAVDNGPPWGWIAGLTALALGLVVLVVATMRRRRRRGQLSPLHELERALRRARRAPAPGATLQGLERAFGASPAAADYVRALREQRYAMRRELAGPTGAQRRGLRAELARGGLRARLRAWWALPPKPPARRRTIDVHG